MNATKTEEVVYSELTAELLTTEVAATFDRLVLHSNLNYDRISVLWLRASLLARYRAFLARQGERIVSILVVGPMCDVTDDTFSVSDPDLYSHWIGDCLSGIVASIRDGREPVLGVIPEPPFKFHRLAFHEIREQTAKDINQLLSQLTDDFTPVTVEWLKEVVQSDTTIFVAIETETGRIVGTVLMHAMKILVGRKDWIEDVIVDREYRKRGIATELMHIAIVASEASNAKNLNLTSTPDKMAAGNMYEKEGFIERTTRVYRRPRHN